MLIDAKDRILGRLCSFAAKKALEGEKVDIINAEKAIFTGDRKKILAEYQRKKEMGIPSKGPFMYNSPEKFVKRSIRGMLPYKKERGKKALSNIKAYSGVPEQFKEKKPQEMKMVKSEKSNLRYLTVKEVCRILGAKR